MKFPTKRIFWFFCIWKITEFMPTCLRGAVFWDIVYVFVRCFYHSWWIKIINVRYSVPMCRHIRDWSRMHWVEQVLMSCLNRQRWVTAHGGADSDGSQTRSFLRHLPPAIICPSCEWKRMRERERERDTTARNSSPPSNITRHWKPPPPRPLDEWMDERTNDLESIVNQNRRRYGDGRADGPTRRQGRV